MNGFKTETNNGLFVTVQLPAQNAMTPETNRFIPAGELTVFHQIRDTEALDNALNLLETLYGHGVSSPAMLRLILTATGHPGNASGHPSAASPATVSLQGSPPHAE
ncbi:hypothetical protein GCM10022631_10740 [Deinococcus rubellus]